ERDLVGEQATIPRQHDTITALFDEPAEVIARQRARRHAITRAQLQLQAFERTRLVVEDLFAADRLLAALDHVEVALRRAHVPEATTVLVRVGGAAEAAVVGLRPVQEVVTALVARSRPVADLVADEAVDAERVVGD